MPARVDNVSNTSRSTGSPRKLMFLILKKSRSLILKVKHASIQQSQESSLKCLFFCICFFFYHTQQTQQRRDAANGDEEKLKRRDEMKSDEIPEGSFS